MFTACRTEMQNSHLRVRQGIVAYKQRWVDLNACNALSITSDSDRQEEGGRKIER